MEVPITGIKYLVSVPISVLLFPHISSPHRVTKVLDTVPLYCPSTQGQMAYFDNVLNKNVTV